MNIAPCPHMQYVPDYLLHHLGTNLEAYPTPPFSTCHFLIRSYAEFTYSSISRQTISGPTSSHSYVLIGRVRNAWQRVYSSFHFYLFIYVLSCLPYSLPTILRCTRFRQKYVYAIRYITHACMLACIQYFFSSFKSFFFNPLRK